MTIILPVPRPCTPLPHGLTIVGGRNLPPQPFPLLQTRNDGYNALRALDM